MSVSPLPAPAAAATNAPLASAVSSTASLSSSSSSSLSPAGSSASLSFASAASSCSECCSEWRHVGLDGLRSELELSALSLVADEERSSAARSALSAASKALKRASAEERLALLGGVVRAYQEEINALTRRSKAAETAYLSLYQLLSSASDPSHALQAATQALQQAASMEAEWARCRQQVDELDTELSTLKNQDATLRRLEAQLREVDRRTEQRVREAVAECEQANRINAAQETREAAEREAALRQAVEDGRAQLAQQAAAHQQQQDAQFKESERYERAVREGERELDSLRADNERLQHALHAANSQRAVRDREGQQLSDSHSPGGTQSAAPAAGEAASKLEAEVQSLREALSAVQRDSADAQQALLAERTEREADRQTAAESAERLTLQLAHWKHKALTASSAGQQHDDGGAQNTAAARTSPTGNEQSEAESNASLLAQLSAAQAAYEQLAQQASEQQTEAADGIHRLSHQLEEAERSSAAQVRLIAQLEADISLLQQQQRPAKQSSAATSLKQPLVPLLSIVSTSNSVAPPTSAVSSPLTSASASADSTVSPLSDSLASPASCCSCASLLSIVSGQRDRLRVRVEQLVSELSERQAALSEARSAKAQLQDDNVQLYEKLQYVKSFEQQQQLGRDGRPSGRGAVQAVSAAASGGMSERRYAKLYAESINPFSAWKSGQLLASERSLPPSERATLTCARLLFSRRAARSIAFFYALVLHLLVFAVLWTHTVTDHCAHADDDGSAE